jgi:glutamate/tyrosine decarboxylase-like PLP-dependent enzyme
MKHPYEETLDPGDWESLRQLGYRMVDDMLAYLESVRHRPVWQPAPEQVKAHFKKPVPLDPQPPEEVYEDFLKNVLPYPIGNIHPRFWGWVFGTGTPLGALADFLAASMNTNSGDFDHHSAIHVDTQLIAWLKEMLGYPIAASGLLTNGCSVANLVGLAVARNAKCGYDLRREGNQGAPNKMMLYASEEIHSSIQKAVELMGLGSDSLRYIPTNQAFQINLESLAQAITADRNAGLLPFCVVGAAGTVNTGAFDDLEALADLCAREELWLHIDGAFGAWAALSNTSKHLVAGMERADSLAFDLHKWMYMPYEIGCVLVQHPETHRDTFALSPAYLAPAGDGRGLSSGSDIPWYTDFDFHLSRGFRSLKAWMSLKEHGARKYGRLIQQNIDQAHYLAALVEAEPQLELAAEVTLNVVCFRYLKPGLNNEALDALNKQIMVELQEQGLAVVSGTILDGRYVLRVALTNHRSRREDFDLLVKEVVRIGLGF